MLCPQVFNAAKVAHVDPGLGLLLQLPMEPEPAAGFVHVSNLSDDGQLTAAEVLKRYKVGRGRVLGQQGWCSAERLDIRNQWGVCGAKPVQQEPAG